MTSQTTRDRITFRSSMEPLKRPALVVLDAIQHSPADIQIEALSLTLAILCRGAGIDPHEMVSRSNRQLLQADRVRNPALEAIADYAAGELS